MRSVTILAGLAVAFALVATGCSSTPPAAPAPTEASDPGEALVQTKCSMCHSLDRVNGAKYDAATWEETIDRMEKNGLVISSEEKQAIVDYLAKQGAK